MRCSPRSSATRSAPPRAWDLCSSSAPASPGSASKSMPLACGRPWRSFRGDPVTTAHNRIDVLHGLADGAILNPGAWTHYSYAIRDALEIARLPAVEVHLSDVAGRDEWRR